MSGLVQELQRDALDSNVKVSGLLRKAYVVATKLNLPEFREWAESELNGYKTVPDTANEALSYRVVRGELKAWNPMRRDWMPVHVHDDKVHESLIRKWIVQSTADLEHLSETADGNLQSNFPPKIQKWFLEHDRDGLEMIPTLHISRNQLVGMLDCVRNIILQWSLKLEADGILGEGMSFSSQEKSLASQHSYAVQNFYGSVAAVNTAGGNMSVFDQRHQKVEKQINVAGNANIQDASTKTELVEHLALIRNDVKRALDAKEIDEEAATEIEYKLAKASQQIEKPTPDKAAVTGYLEGAQKFLSKAQSMAGNVAKIALAIDKVRQLFS